MNVLFYYPARRPAAPDRGASHVRESEAAVFPEILFYFQLRFARYGVGSWLFESPAVQVGSFRASGSFCLRGTFANRHTRSATPKSTK